MLVIPAIDLKDGHCVRLQQGDMQAATVFSDDPAQMARHWQEEGATRMHLVDLNGAFAADPGDREGGYPHDRRHQGAAGAGSRRNHGRDRRTVAVRRHTRLQGSGRGLRVADMPLAKRIIPCLDIAAGRVVKGVNFVNLRDAGDPVEVAKRYGEQGADELAFLDITASVETRGLLYQMISDVAEQVFIPLTVGGGVRAVEDVRALLNAGADKVSINTAGIKNPQLIADAAARYGAQAIVVAIDAKASAPDRWEVFTHGGRHNTGTDAVEWAREVERLGAG